MSQFDLRAEIEALFERAERDARRRETEAFQRGWEAALQHVMSAASRASMPDAPIKDVGARERKGKAAYGVVPPTVRASLEMSGERGITPADPVALGQSRGEEFAESSVRRVLRNMRDAGEVRNERGRWFLVQLPKTAADEENGDAATSPSDTVDDDGGFHAAA